MKIKKVVIALLCAILLFTPTKVFAVETSPYDNWKTTAIISPYKGEQKASGPIVVQFKALDGAMAYDIYVDDILKKENLKSKSKTIETEIYVTKTAVHSVEVVAKKSNGYQIHSNIRHFLVSKKGLSIDDKVVQNKVKTMNESWYYNWGTNTSTHVSGKKEFVPMIWNQATLNWLSSNETQKYSTVLGFNEPDNAFESNMSARDAANYQDNFSQSGLRIGAPSTTYAPANNAWFDEYLKYVDLDDIDFIPVHIYYNWGGDGMAENFLKEIDDTYKKYGKPIWITEFGLSNQGNNNFYGCYDNPSFDVNQQVKEYMTNVIEGLEKRDYVERYAWFSFGTDSSTGGKTALYNQQTGQLTSLGETYSRLGNPIIEDEEALKDQYVQDESEVLFTQESYSLNINETMQLQPQITNGQTSDLVWQSDDESIAIVDQNGNVTGKKAGTVKIKVSLHDISAICSVKVTSPITNIELEQKELTMNKGTKQKLNLTLYPLDTTDDKTLTWESKNEDIATVSQTGVITAKNVGETDIVVTTQNGKTASAHIEVVILANQIELNASKIALNQGQNSVLEAKLYPDTTTEKANFTYESSNSQIAMIDQNGHITAMSPGQAILTVRHNGLSASCQVTVYPSVEKINLNDSEISVEKGQTYKINPIILPKEAIGNAQLTYQSLNDTVATINQNGVITGISAGQVDIVITSDNGVQKVCHVNVTVPATQIQLKQEKIVVNKDEVVSIEAQLYPYDTTDSQIQYVSQDETIATVNQNGQIKGIQSGTTQIIVKTPSGLKAVCQVTVQVPMISISINQTSLILNKGDTHKLYASVQPYDTTDDKTFIWLSSNKDVATVDQSGNITAISNGKADIMVKTTQGIQQATCHVTVTTKATDIVLNTKKVNLNIGESQMLKAQLTPKDTTDTPILKWTSYNSKVATVDQSGKITALKPGTTQITVTHQNGLIASCQVYVYAPITNVQLNNQHISMVEGQKQTLKAQIYPLNTTDDKTLTWTSENNDIASVSQNGQITAKKAGTTFITVTTKNQKVSTCQIDVRERKIVTLDKQKMVIYPNQSQTLKVTSGKTEQMTWTSSNTNVATVNNGVIYAKKAGTTVIKVSNSDQSVAECRITVPYLVTYQLNGGQNTTANPKYYYGKTITLKNATRTGYLFGGWYKDKNFKTKVTSFKNGNQKLYAKWIKVNVNQAKTPTLKNVSKGKLNISYQATSGAKGYQIQYATNKKFTKATTKTLSGRSATYTLSKGKTYYVRVRAYKLDSKGNKVYGKYSSMKKITLKK